MKFPLLFLILIALTTFFTGCAKKYNPEEVCTAKWIKPRVDSAMSDFKSNADSAIDVLQKAAKNVDADGKFSPLSMMKAMLSMATLVTKFQNGDAIEDLRILSKTCDDPELVTKALTDFLEEEGAPDDFINLLKDLDGFKKLLNEQASEA